jgi:hypothetical protein
MKHDPNKLPPLSTQAPRPARRPYQKPRLVPFGALTDITKTVSFNSVTADGGAGMSSKTQ